MYLLDEGAGAPASGEVKVMDFGIARLETARQRLTTTGEFVGTPLYTAPEQAKTEDVDGRADVFSPASVAYTLLGVGPLLRPHDPRDRAPRR